MTSPLSETLRLPCGAVLRNRLAKAAMSETLGDRTCAPTKALVTVYERWGRSGAALLITGNVMIDRRALGEPGNVVVEDDRDLLTLRAWAAGAHMGGAAIWMQLNHPGRQSPAILSREPVAPSAVPMRPAGMFRPPRALRDDEIVAIIARFGSAAAVAKRAGFDGVEVHGAHGYLANQFLSPRTNLRNDRWGGSLSKRMAFLLAVVAAIREQVGPAFPVGVKLNSADFQRGGFTIEESMQVARALEAAGVDLLEVSGGSYEAPAMVGDQRESTRQREAFFLEYAARIRSVTTLPLLLTGGMRTAAVMSEAITSGAVDMVGLARPMTVEPDLPARLLEGSSAGARDLQVHTRNRALDAFLQVAWFQQQIHRMGRGLDPDPRRGVLPVLGRALADGVVARWRR